VNPEIEEQGAMLRNYLIVAWRNLVRQRLFAIINVAGLAVGLASCLIIGLYVQDELGSDRHHEHADRIHRVVNGSSLHTPAALGPALVGDLPDVVQYVRFRPPSGVWLMRHEDRAFYETRVFWMDATGLEVFSFPFVRGDPETALSEPYSVVITESTARRYFGARDPMGEIIRAEDAWDLRVTGVVEDMPPNSHYEHELEPNSDFSYVVGLVSIAALILLVACVNFTNLATARFARRAREVGVRKAAGSSGGQLARQFLGESALLSVGAGAIALSIANACLPVVNGASGKALSLSALAEPLAAGTALAVVVLTGLLAGAYPSLYLANLAPVAVLKGRLRGGKTAGSFRRTLVVVQFAISTVLLVGAAAVHAQLRFVQSKDLGFDKEQVLVVPLSVQVLLDRAEALKEALKGDPAIESVAQSSSMPGRSGSAGALWRYPVRLDGWPEGETLDMPLLGVDLDFRESLGLELVAGRWLRAGDLQGRGRSPVVLVNEAAMRRLGWGSPQGALDQEIVYAGGRRSTVIGVLRDFHFESLHRDTAPLAVAYGPSNYLSVRLSAGATLPGLDALRQAWQRVYPDYPLHFTFLDDDFDALYRNEQRLLSMLTGFALVAVFTACLGVFGLVSFATENRTREIGIRKALGASVHGLVLLLSREMLALVLLANLLAWPVAYWAMQQWLKGFAYRTALGPEAFALAWVASLGLAWLAMGWQTVRTSLGDPVNALRCE